MKKQALFSWKDKSKKLKCRLLQFLFGALRVKELEKAPIFDRALSSRAENRSHKCCFPFFEMAGKQDMRPVTFKLHKTNVVTSY